jgi:hypothetical protein
MAGPRNPFLADSTYPIAHGRCDQQDNTAVRGPVGPTAVLDERDITYAPVGPGHFGHCISGRYPDGGRVIWSNGREQIVKLDYETLEVLARYPLPGVEQSSQDDLEAAARQLDTVSGPEAINLAVSLAFKYMTGLDGVYAALDCDHTFFLGTKRGAVAYADAEPGNRHSGIVEVRRWEKPPEIGGDFVGVNMTFDGRLVMSTEHGWIISLARDFSEFDAIQLRHSEIAAAWCDEQLNKRGRRGYGWLRTSLCVDDANGIYTNSRDHLHKVIWTGTRLSIDESDGAWTAAYRNGGGNGSGTTPSLMGFANDNGSSDDRFVVIGDGDRVVNITLMWRDEIPSGWTPPPGAPSSRIAGYGPAHMGDPNVTDIQTEQSITVSGYGAMTVNNEPASVPDGFPPAAVRLLVGYLGADPAYTPYGMHKYEWDPDTKQFRNAWVNTKVSSPNAVPFVSEGANLVYTVGVRDRQWTVEALDWTTGAEAFHYVVGGARYNSLFAGLTLDDDGRFLYGTSFGKLRLNR